MSVHNVNNDITLKIAHFTVNRIKRRKPDVLNYLDNNHIDLAVFCERILKPDSPVPLG